LPPYGPPDLLAVLRSVIEEIRSVVPSSFVVGLKLNAADYVAGGMSEDQALQQLQAISQWGYVDFIEISGGDYEKLGKKPFILSTSSL
jgi:2,4-dienoyl-CoA reductase-like NADH-dependent reductase (Old Yellow Enzyme family)